MRTIYVEKKKNEKRGRAKGRSAENSRRRRGKKMIKGKGRKN